MSTHRRLNAMSDVDDVTLHVLGIDAFRLFEKNLVPVQYVSLLSSRTSVRPYASGVVTIEIPTGALILGIESERSRANRILIDDIVHEKGSMTIHVWNIHSRSIVVQLAARVVMPLIPVAVR